MTAFLDKKFINLVSSQLDKFKWQRATLANCRCPLCGDSQKNKNKCRGYFYERDARYYYKCHNCGVGRTLPNFLKDNAPDLYDEYIMERYKSGTTGKGSYVPKPKFNKPVFKKKEDLESISSLNNEHPAVKYLADRQIPKKFWNELFYTKDFCTWVNKNKPSFTQIKNDKPRIVIPFIKPSKKEDGGWRPGSSRKGDS